MSFVRVVFVSGFECCLFHVGVTGFLGRSMALMQVADRQEEPKNEDQLVVAN